MKLFAAVLSVVSATTMPTLLLAKGDTVQTTFESPTLAARIEITDPHRLNKRVFRIVRWIPSFGQKN
jgi:hypothetical protein